MTEQFLLNGATTAIGSLPHKDAAAAVEFILNNDLDIPAWPQLPARAFLEHMIPQYSEGLPFVEVDEAQRRIRCEIPADKSEGLTEFFEKYLADDPTAFAHTPATTAGFFAFVDELKKRGAKYDCVKGAVCGPVTTTMGLADAEKRPIYYDTDMRDAAVKLLAMKARWQVRQLAPYCGKVLIFQDEPVLAGFGTSAYLSLKAEDVIAMCDEINDAIHAEGALSGIHCCGNTDWAMVMAAKFDLVNFDAYEFAQAVALYPGAVKEFLGRGGVLAWGAVPTTQDIDTTDLDEIYSRLSEGMSALAGKGVAEEALRRQCVLTPSCGAGNLNEKQCAKVFDLLSQLRNRFRQ